MYRRNKERRTYRRRRGEYDRPGRGFTSAFRRPAAQIGLLVVVGIVIYLILQAGSGGAALPGQISVGEAYSKYQNGAFVLDVRTQEEWDDFHAPNTTLIPLDQLASRLNELPRDREIVVVCRSGNRSTLAWAVARSEDGVPREELERCANQAGFDLGPVAHLIGD